MLAKTFLQHPLRLIGRTAWLSSAFILAALDYAINVTFRGSESRRIQRGLWLQRNARRVLRVGRIGWQAKGTIPNHGLLVSNHLSYVDVLVLAAIAPAVFVAKSEMRRWPVLGWFAKIAGTIFVHRAQRREVLRSTNEISAGLSRGDLLVLFAEGTSSNGETVLPFKSSLLQPATTQNCPVHVAYISYSLDDGDVVEEVCYWRDMTLLPHMLNLLGKSHVLAEVSFARVAATNGDRKQLAHQLHAEVLRLKESTASANPTLSNINGHGPNVT